MAELLEGLRAALDARRAMYARHHEEERASAREVSSAIAACLPDGWTVGRYVYETGLQRTAGKSVWLELDLDRHWIASAAHDASDSTRCGTPYPVVSGQPRNTPSDALRSLLDAVRGKRMRARCASVVRDLEALAAFLEVEIPRHG